MTIPLIGIHGFSYDPASKKHSPLPLYREWEKMLHQSIIPFEYYSYPIGLTWDSFKAYGRALREGFWNKYVAAFKEAAPEAAKNLLTMVYDDPGQVNLIGHSLGSRVINLMLMTLRPGHVNRILLLEGAELQINALTQLPPGVEVLNIFSRSDRVLEDLGSVFNCEAFNGCIGRDGLGRKMDRWHDLCLDDPATQALVKKKRGWELDGTPEHVSLNLVEDIQDYGGHWRAYNDPKNGPLYEAWLGGDPLSDILGG